MRPQVTRLILPPVLAVFASCSTRPSTYHLDYTQYPKLPDAPTSVAYRTLATITPGFRSKIIYGNYGGPGSKPGQPVDDMDEMFRRHDIVYFESHTLAQLRESDHLLVHRLKTLDPGSLARKARRYRDRAIRFFESDLSERLGKPRDVRKGKRKPVSVIPGRREEAEGLWKWQGTDPDAVSAGARK